MILKSYLVAVFGGALSITSPCTFPLLVPFTAFLAISAINDRRYGRNRPITRTILRMALIMTGVSLVFTMFANPNSIGGAFVHDFNNILVIIAGILLLMIGLYYFRRKDVKTKSTNSWMPTIVTPVFVGGAFGLAALPCCLGRILAAILMTKANINQSLLLLGYMIGLSIMFVLVGGLILALILRLARSDKSRRLVVLISSILLIIMGILLIGGWWSDYIFKLSRYAITTKTLPVRLEERLLQIFGMI